MPAKKRMTLEQFLVALERTMRGPKALKWYRDKYGSIRGRIGECICCPIIAVSGRVGVAPWKPAANALGLWPKTAQRIAMASDFDHQYPRLRRRLLKALHLTEVEHG